MILMYSVFSEGNQELGVMIIKIMLAAFFAILFLQSGLDKVFNWKDNLGWLKGHFANSILSGIVPFMLLKITAAEVIAGALSLIGIYGTIVGNDLFLELGLLLSAFSLGALFFGQRLAKDYPGAGALVPYFIVALGGMVFMLFF